MFSVHDNGVTTCGQNLLLVVSDPMASIKGCYTRRSKLILRHNYWLPLN